MGIMIIRTVFKEQEVLSKTFGLKKETFSKSNYRTLYLKVLNWVLLACSFFTLLFQIVNYAWAHHYKTDDPDNTKYSVICNVVTGNPKVDAWMKLLEQLVVYIIWQYPFFYIFWIKKRSASHESKKDNLLRDHQLSF
jgi:hypothetical protein